MKKNKPKRYESDNAQLISEWNWEKNTDFNPSQLTLGSNKKVWWKCNKEHEWQAIISDRYRRTDVKNCIEYSENIFIQIMRSAVCI